MSATGAYWLIKSEERLAFQSLARFQQVEPDSARSHILLGDIDRQRERYDDAIAEYRKALAVSPDNLAALLGLATAKLNNNDIDDALSVVGAALAVSPSDPDANLVMAQALIDNHQYAKAEPFLARSMSVKPQMRPHVHALLGQVYAENGNFSRAVVELKIGESSDVDGSVHYHLGRVYHQLGETQNAAIAFDQAKAIKQKRREQKLIAVDDPDSPPPPSGP